MSARASSNTERRKKGFQKTIDADDARRKREDNIIELRKAKRDEGLQKKRATNTGPTAGGIEESNRSNAVVQQKVISYKPDQNLNQNYLLSCLSEPRRMMIIYTVYILCHVRIAWMSRSASQSMGRCGTPFQPRLSKVQQFGHTLR